MKGIKRIAWDWCSKYIRLRDALEYKDLDFSPVGEYARCCTCGGLNCARKWTPATLSVGVWAVQAV